MKKLFFLLSFFCISAMVTFAQNVEKDTLWTHGGKIGINLSQSYFNNWTSGGQNNINGLGILKYKVNYLKDKSKWENNFDFALGYTYYDFDKKPVKTDDYINLGSLYGYDIVKDKLFLTSELSFKTQFANGYEYSKDSTNKISGFLAPAYLALGIGAQWVPCKYFSLTLSPVTGRLTIVNDQELANQGAFGVTGAITDTLGNIIEKGKRTRLELGAQITAKFEYEIFENVTFSSKLGIFCDYIHSRKLNALGEKYKCRPDFDWDNALIMKINNWLSCNVTAHLLYDEDIKPIEGDYFLQFKEVFSIGISYSIP